jgi:UDPglucose--hexose-1-phosphate uridylyltransferase
MASNYDPETRQDRITQQWVACAPERSGRPHKTGERDPVQDPTDDTPVEGCPFCPGHEDMLASLLWELGADDDRPWRTRTVSNKYAALTPTNAPEEQACGLYRTRTSYGRQEVIIDTPYHYQGLVHMPVSQVDAVLQTYLARYHTLRQADQTLYPFLFRNHGAKAGASIPHPHSQIIAPDFAPPQIEQEEEAARTRYDETGQCPYCEMIEEELAAEVRVVWTSDEYVVFVPFAARVPYELWILPRTHEPEFGRLSGERRTALARALQEAVTRLHTHLNDPDYNVFVRTALDYESDAPHLHWSLRLQPRTTVQAGFELSTGVRINPSIPERDAAELRGDA